ncbi:hypothetical protein GCM10010289_66170 [Streptomyces violascens]|uniref:Schlafen group 3-like DNA/RNA helicase domain-containing protein n=2 Tax=Streptomyces violascens TaxID=67381 RepID=A0ABQ3QLH9_9ACTN|nr:hypothetical protein GCM10010289_66170 [Streptomyces violascens]GHI38116.1 hypothetical protein Sviol_25240 [Streptomyces violascens]
MPGNVKPEQSVPDADVDRLIRNTYKVLLTRGMIGTLVYSPDAETREKLRELAGAEAYTRQSQAAAPALSTGSGPRG